MARSRLLVCGAIASIAAALGCSGVQRATLTTPLPVTTIEVAPPPDATKVVYRAPRSRLHVHASDLLNGDHSIVFRKFRGSAEIDPRGRGVFHLDVDMRTLEAENDFITDFAKYELLEVDIHPRATIVATIAPTDEPQIYKLTGNVTLHGVERGIAFDATLVRRGDAIDLHAVFKMSRAEFAMRARRADWIIQDDLRITLDLHAGPEQVTIEPLP